MFYLLRKRADHIKPVNLVPLAEYQAKINAPYVYQDFNPTKDNQGFNPTGSFFVAKDKPRNYERVCRMSYNNAVSYISGRPTLSIYNGSTFNRKPANTPLTDEQKLQKEIDDAYFECKQKQKDNNYQGGVKYDIKYLAKREKNADQEPNPGNRLSRRTKEKIRDKILALYRACAGRKGFRYDRVDFTFVTLTFVNKIDDQAAVNLLGKFFDAVKLKYGKFHYIWVAERQGNGNIHFHLLADKRFELSYCNALWIKQQKESGIVNYKSEQKIYKETGKTFADMFRSKDYTGIQKYLNPFDAKTVKTIDGVSAYLTNYVTKNTDTFNCAAWHSSHTVSKLFTNALITKEIFDFTSNNKINRIKGEWTDKETGEIYERTYINKTYYGQYCTLNSIYNKNKFRKYLNDMESVNRYLLEVYRPEIIQDNKIVKQQVSAEFIRKEITITRDEFREQYYIIGKSFVTTKKESVNIKKFFSNN